MGYLVKCGSRDCGKETFVDNITDLVDNQTDSQGRLKCAICGHTGAYVYRESKLQEKGQTWPRWIKGVIRITTSFETYSPYVLLSADTEAGAVTDVHFGYYKDMRPQGGKLKHGHGPGGGPALNKEEILQLVKRLLLYGFLSADDIESVLSGLDEETPERL